MAHKVDSPHFVIGKLLFCSVNLAKSLLFCKLRYRFISEQKFEDSSVTIEDSSVTISIGLTELQSDDTVKSCLERADSALFKAKNNGRNTVYYSDNNLKIVAYPNAS
ncbi:diguanylate cyclase domain-containing protein [Pseudoalteromonas sp. SaAl2]